MLAGRKRELANFTFCFLHTGAWRKHRSYLSSHIWYQRWKPMQLSLDFIKICWYFQSTYQFIFHIFKNICFDFCYSTRFEQKKVGNSLFTFAHSYTKCVPSCICLHTYIQTHTYMHSYMHVEHTFIHNAFTHM